MSVKKTGITSDSLHIDTAAVLHVAHTDSNLSPLTDLSSDGPEVGGITLSDKPLDGFQFSAKFKKGSSFLKGRLISPLRWKSQSN